MVSLISHNWRCPWTPSKASMGRTLVFVDFFWLWASLIEMRVSTAMHFQPTWVFSFGQFTFKAKARWAQKGRLEEGFFLQDHKYCMIWAICWIHWVPIYHPQSYSIPLVQKLTFAGLGHPYGFWVIVLHFSGPSSHLNLLQACRPTCNFEYELIDQISHSTEIIHQISHKHKH